MLLCILCVYGPSAWNKTDDDDDDDDDDKLLRHLIPGRAGPAINGRFRRRTGNHVFISTSFSGGPALQFGSLQRNIYSSYRTGLAPRHSSQLGFNFCF